MELSFTHSFRAPVVDVLATLADPDYARSLSRAHSFFAEIELLSLHASPRRLARTVRYRARPFLAQLGPFSPPPAWFVWTEHAELDRTALLLRFDNVPELSSVRDKIVNRGTMQFHETRDAHGPLTTREARFELDLRVARVYAALAEVALSRIGSKLASSLDEEARFLARWLSPEDVGAGGRTLSQPA